MGEAIKTVIFDMDGILFDTERLITECWYRIADEKKIPRMEEVLKCCIGLNNHDSKTVFCEAYGARVNFEAFQKEASRLFHERIEREGLPVMKGAYEILEYLKKKGCRIGLASSTKEESVRSHLKRAEMTEYFETIVCGDMVVHSKPDPEIYRLAMSRLGALPKESVAVEDSFNGIRAAHAAGMRAVMVPDMLEPTKEIEELLYGKCKDLLELKELL